MNRIRVFFRVWRKRGLTRALDFWLYRCPLCHTYHGWPSKCGDA